MSQGSAPRYLTCTEKGEDHVIMTAQDNEQVCIKCGQSFGWEDQRISYVESKDNKGILYGALFTHSNYVYRHMLGSMAGYWGHNGLMKHVKKVVSIASQELLGQRLTVEQGLRNDLICRVIDYVMAKYTYVKKVEKRKLRKGELDIYIKEAIDSLRQR